MSELRSVDPVRRRLAMAAVVAPVVGCGDQPADPVQAVLVQVNWPQASAEAVEAQVVSPLEAGLLARLPVREMHSRANSNGDGHIEVLLPAPSAEQAVAEVRQAVDALAAALPSGASRPVAAQGRIRPLAAAATGNTP